MIVAGASGKVFSSFTYQYVYMPGLLYLVTNTHGISAPKMYYIYTLFWENRAKITPRIYLHFLWLDMIINCYLYHKILAKSDSDICFPMKKLLMLGIRRMTQGISGTVMHKRVGTL